MTSRAFRITIDVTDTGSMFETSVDVTGDNPTTIEVVGALHIAIDTHLSSKREGTMRVGQTPIPLKSAGDVRSAAGQEAARRMGFTVDPTRRLDDDQCLCGEIGPHFCPIVTGG